MRLITMDEMMAVSGCDKDTEAILVSGAECVGALLTIAGSDGTALLLGAGLVAMGSCTDFLDKIDPPTPSRRSVSGVITEADPGAMYSNGSSCPRDLVELVNGKGSSSSSSSSSKNGSGRK